MSSIDDKLNEVLNIADEVLENKKEKNPLEIVNEPAVPVAPKNADAETDFETGRKNLYNLLDKGNEAREGILSLAKEGEHPRAYEVAGQLIKTQSEVAQNLLDLQGPLKKLTEEKILNLFYDGVHMDEDKTQTVDGVSVTYHGTFYGDNCEVEASGDFKEEE